jgi:membrane protease YdiL (CAAX protease family)
MTSADPNQGPDPAEWVDPASDPSPTPVVIENNGWYSDAESLDSGQPPLYPRHPALIPNLAHTVVFAALLIPSFLGGGILAFVILLAILHPASPRIVLDSIGREIRYAIATQAIVYGIQWALAGFVFTMWWGRSMLQGIEWNAAAARRWLVALAMIGIVTGLAMTVAGNFVPMPKAPPILQDLTKSRMGAFMMMAFGITLAPLTEELAFRGFILPSLVNVFRWLQRRGSIAEREVRLVGVPVSIVVTSFCFAMVHSGQVSHSWGPLLLIGMVSVVLCVVRLRMSSVAAGVVVHAAYNLTLFTALLIQTGGFRHLEKLNG